MSSKPGSKRPVSVPATRALPAARAASRARADSVARSARGTSLAASKQQRRMPTTRRVTTPQDSNLMGTVFGGAILSEIDLAAAIEAHKVHPGNVVTVAMDKIEFHRPVFVGDLISLYTKIARKGRTSVTVCVSVWAERRMPPFESVEVTEALVTMVAVNEAMLPVPLSSVSRPR